MERTGLPTAFGTTQGSEAAPHEASNMVASASNADTTPLAPLKPVLQPESEQAAAEIPPPIMSSEVKIIENGVFNKPVNGNHVPVVEHSNQSHLSDALPTESTQSVDQPDSSLSVPVTTESITIASVSAPDKSLALPGEVVEAATEMDFVPQQSITNFHTKPTPIPEQPISDLRSSPQTVIKDEAQPSILETATETVITESHPETSVLAQETNQTTEIMSHTEALNAGDSAAAQLEVAPSTEVKLPSPPTQSLSPAPHREEAAPSADHAMSDIPDVAPQDDAPMPEAPASLPVEEPRDPAPTPAVPAKSQATEDQTMTDAPEISQVKVAREREDDMDESEPLAKRARTEADEDQSSFKVPEVPTTAQTPPVTNGASEIDEDDTVTPARLAHMKKIISNLKKGNSSTAFRAPVDPVALNIPTYVDIIKEPMDLGTIDTKLKNKQYAGVSEFVRDFHLVVNNSYTFNGREHVVSQQAAKMESSFTSQIKNMPPANLVEPSKEEKKLQKPKIEPVRQAPPRRQSMTAGGGSARSPSASNNPTTFALGPEGVPLIRRDSNVNDGRAKRAVVPPKRHSDFAGRPKKKKYELELKFCWEVLKELQHARNWSFAQFFYAPVDPVALNIPTYFQIIKKPMDLGTIQSKLENNAYEKASEFREDVQLIFKNCYKFNSEGEFVNDCGHKLEELFNKKWEGKDDWIASRQPESEPHSTAEDEDEEDEESDEAEDDSEDERNNKILQLQKQIEMMSKQMGELTQPKKKKKSTPPMPPKKNKIKGDKKDKAAAPKARKEEAQPKKKTKKPKEEKERFVTYSEKQYISNGISQLPDKQMGEALKLIQQNVPHLKGVEETEIELDIDELPNKVLLKLLHFVEKSGGGPLPPAPASEATVAAPAATGGKPKKNKPMGKSEQEAQIEELRGKLNNFASGGGGYSPNASKFNLFLSA